MNAPNQKHRRADQAKRRPLIGIPAASDDQAENAATAMFRFNASYTAALAGAGALPVAIPLRLPDDVVHDLLARLDGLCLSGGVDVDPAHFDEAPHPALGRVDAARDETELRLARWALAADMPILGICRGIQLLNVAAGGSLFQDLAAQLPETRRHAFKLSESPRHRPAHDVRVALGSKLHAVLGASEIQVNSYHHQAVKRIADGFSAVAWADDGVVEAIEHPGLRFAIGVQWHPEGMVGSAAHARRLFEGFVAAARTTLQPAQEEEL